MTFLHKLKLVAAMLLLASPVDAQDDDEARQVRRLVEGGLVPAVMVQGGPQLYGLTERMAYYNVPALSVAVIRGGELVFADAFGDASPGAPATPVTLFQAASLSKPVTAIAVMRLVEKGLLDLDADIRGYLKSWSLPEGMPDVPVTIRQILSHTAGFTVHGFRGYAPGEDVPTTLDILNGAGPANSAPVVIDQTPGQAWRYSGGGYTVLQLLIEDVTGKPFAEVMRDEVLAPAGMERSSYVQPLPSDWGAQLAAAHDYKGNFTPTHIYPEQAAASLWTTPRELAGLLAELSRIYQGGEGWLGHKSVQDLATQVFEGMGPGFAVDGEGRNLRLTHGGSNKGFRSFMALYPERGDGIVVMTNAAAGGGMQMEVVRSIAAQYGWPEFEPRKIAPVKLSDEQLAALAGRYHVAAHGFDIDVAPTAGGLELAVTRGSRYLAYPVSETELTIREDGATITVVGNGVLKLWGMTAERVD